MSRVSSFLQSGNKNEKVASDSFCCQLKISSIKIKVVSSYVQMAHRKAHAWRKGGYTCNQFHNLPPPGFIGKTVRQVVDEKGA